MPLTAPPWSQSPHTPAGTAPKSQLGPSYYYLAARLQLRNVIKALSMIHTIEKINNSTFLPGITLGYEIYDSCSYVEKAIQSTIKLFPELNKMNNNSQCNNTEIIPSVKAVIGEIYSEISVAVARILSLHFIPLVSPASTVTFLSDTLKFPSFLRTVPSDKYQTQTIAKLIRAFGWNWVGVISSDDDYGRSGLDYINRFLEEERICKAFSKIVPSNVEYPSMAKEINIILNELSNCTANVVVIFANSPTIIKVLQECIRRNISRTWIASDSWSISREVSRIKNINKVGTILGIDFEARQVQGFDDYLKNLQPPPHGAINTFLKAYKELRFGCTDDYKKYLDCINSSSKYCPQTDSISQKSALACSVGNINLANDDYLVQHIEISTTYSTILAVTAIAQAVKNIMCSNGNCEKLKSLPPHELLDEIRHVQLTYNNKNISFEDHGDFLNGYDIVNWHTVDGYTSFKRVGKYNILKSEIKVDKSLIFWNTKDNEIPMSNCSKPCKPGFYKKYSIISCCYDCIPCPEGHYTSASDMNECLMCPLAQWSNNGSSKCENRTTEYLQWKNPFAVALTSFAAFGFALVVLTGVFFIKYSDTSEVKAVGGNYTYLLGISLLVSLVSIVLFIGYPTNIICKCRQIVYSISLTLCVSCILVKSLRIILDFESYKSGKPTPALTYQPVVLIAVLTGLQFCLCMLWLILKEPFVIEVNIIPKIIIAQCNEGSYVAFGIMLGYIGFLALASFILAYRGRKLPDKYKEAKCITFSMLIYMFVWVMFIPVYMNVNGIYRPAVQVVAILASSFGIISCHLVPTCYIILLKRNSIIKPNCDKKNYTRETQNGIGGKLSLRRRRRSY
ncbi:G-protein coupled receptor family C group 6 member A-like [Bombina bombina]|uniref:G-protein coupled receptor family C group 6 member A-like n=1 Tax=Bombina bombina TaxID=8345 RepID=UPI00235AE8E4|nr:G-protein coupled receptor family C group 6 member A-like [Bombina bombina]